MWVKEVGFTPDSGPQPVVATGTAYGHVRLYDTRAQRRPVYSKQYGEEPITALDLTPDGRLASIYGGYCETHTSFAVNVSTHSLQVLCGWEQHWRTSTI